MIGVLDQLSDSDLGKNTLKDLQSLMQLNLAHNTLRKMPAGIPHSLHQLFLDKNRIDDIPEQVHTADTLDSEVDTHTKFTI